MLPAATAPAGAVTGDTGHVIWAVFDFIIDPATLGVELVFPRTGDAHYNVNSIILPPNCDHCIKIQVVGIDPLEKIYSINVTLENPSQLTGHDVRGTLLFDAGDPRELVNPDDYTKMFDDDSPADINPFTVFGKSMSKREFFPGQAHTELYKIRFPDPPDFVVSFVVDASWPGNQKEPYEIVDQEIDGDLDEMGFDERTIGCIVRDWQNNVEYVKIDLSALGFPGEVELNHGAGNYYYLSITNEYGAAPGDYRCLISAKSADNPWLIYDYITITVVESAQGPPTWVDTIGITGAYPANGEVTVTYGVAVDPDIPVHYNIYWSEETPVDFGSAFVLPDFDGSPFTVDGLTNGQEYHFAVRAEDALGYEDDNTNELPATPLHEPAEEWSVATSGFIHSSPVFVDLNGDSIEDIVIGSYYYCYALSGVDGSEIWAFTAGDIIESSPAVAYETSGGVNIDIVIGSQDKNVYRIDGDTGDQVWAFPTGGYVYASPALADINHDSYMDAIVGSFDGYLYAISGQDGTQLWSYDAGGAIYSSAALGDITGDGVPDAFVGCRDNYVHAVNGASGAGIWTFETGDFVNGSPALYDFTGDEVLDVVVTSLDSYLYIINGATHAEYLSYPTDGPCWTSPAIGYINGDLVPDIVFGSDDYNLYALSGADLSLIWSFTSGDRIFSSAALAELTGDSIVDAVVGSDDYMLYLVDGATGDSAWVVPTGNWVECSPCIGDPDNDGISEIAVGSFDGMVYLLSAEMPYPAAGLIPWPKFRRNWELTGLFD
jgi:outer membrane protein assembly factor BamB